MNPDMVDYQYMKPSFMAKIQQFKQHFYHIQQGLPGLSPGIPWPAATYAVSNNIIDFTRVNVSMEEVRNHIKSISLFPNYIILWSI